MAISVFKFYWKLYNTHFYLHEKQTVPKILLITAFSQNRSINYNVNILNIQRAVDTEPSGNTKSYADVPHLQGHYGLVGEMGWKPKNPNNMVKQIL